jgi:ubiquinone/menaquinone biosynthesis C-methylase UbiE
MKDSIKHNKEAHDTIAKVYDLKHAEIYNEVEQQRLNETIKDLILLFRGKDTPQVLDFGAGTGNLSLKFLHNV